MARKPQLTKSQRKKIAAIRARGLSEGYAKRLIRGVVGGVKSLYQRFFPPKKRVSKKVAAKIAEIKSKGYSPAYEKRLINAARKGKSTQAARGHAPGEAAKRREAERERNGGLSTREVYAIREFHTKFLTNGKSEPDLETLIEWVQENGYQRFKDYRAIWSAQRKTYLRSLVTGTYASKGLDFLDLLRDEAGMTDEVSSIKWLYYH